MVAAEILPKPLQAPDHVQLAVGKMFEEAIAYETDHVFPVVIALVGDFLLQDGADGNHRGEGITENQELQKEFAAENAEGCGKNDCREAEDFHNRGE